MDKNTFNNISMNGRMAYAILCIEKYLINKYPLDDWKPLSKIMWEVTSSFWDEWDGKFIEIIPENLFENDSYEESGFEEITEDEYNTFAALLKDKSDELNELLYKLHELQEIYCYSSIPGKGDDASQIVLNICDILERHDIELPDIAKVNFSSFSEKNGWGNNFDGTKLSFILS